MERDLVRMARGEWEGHGRGGAAGEGGRAGAGLREQRDVGVQCRMTGRALSRVRDRGASADAEESGVTGMHTEALANWRSGHLPPPPPLVSVPHTAVQAMADDR